MKGIISFIIIAVFTLHLGGCLVQERVGTPAKKVVVKEKKEPKPIKEPKKKQEKKVEKKSKETKKNTKKSTQTRSEENGPKPENNVPEIQSSPQHHADFSTF